MFPVSIKIATFLSSLTQQQLIHKYKFYIGKSIGTKTTAKASHISYSYAPHFAS